MPLAPISELAVFGDSLSDEGRMSDLTSRNLVITLPSPDAGYTRAYSNGPVYAEVMSDLLIRSGDLGASENFAIGGARAASEVTFAEYVDARVGTLLPPGAIYRPDADPDDLGLVIDLSGQVERHIDSGPASDGAVAINIGLNDYADFVPSSPEDAEEEATELAQSVLVATAAAAVASVAAGADQVILFNLPSMRLFPLAAARPESDLALGDQLIAGHNEGLVEIVDQLDLIGAEAVVVDMNRISAEIMADAATFGFRPELMAQPVLLGTGSPELVEQPDGSFAPGFPENPTVSGIDPDQIAFWDFVHPTAALHAIWGAFAAESPRSETRFLGAENDRINGGADRDLILADAGDDRISARGGPDVVIAGLGDDVVRGDEGADILIGGSGRDRLSGGAGNDVLADGAGRDLSAGGRGGDLLIDGAGFDRLGGGPGSDDFVFKAATLGGGTLAGNGGVIRGGPGRDTVYLVLDAETRAAVEAELDTGSGTVRLPSIGLTLRGIESVALLDPDDVAGEIDSPARLLEADHWGLV